MNTNQLNSGLVQKLYPIACKLSARLPRSLIKIHDSLILSDELLTIIDTRSSSDQTIEPLIVRTDNPVEFSCSVYYFEVTIHAASNMECISVGFCSTNSSYSKWLGSDSHSFGYSNRNGIAHRAGEGISLDAPQYSSSDVIGCGINFVNKSTFFTKNGIYIGSINIASKLHSQRLFPAIAFGGSNTSITINLGHKEFRYDIFKHIEHERALAVGLTIERKCSDQLAYSAMKNLVSSYLLHYGYLGTAKSLLNSESSSISNNFSKDSFVENNSVKKLSETSTKPVQNRIEIPPNSLSTIEPSLNRVDSFTTPTSVGVNKSSFAQLSNLNTPLETLIFDESYALKLDEEDLDSKNFLKPWPETDQQALNRILVITTILKGNYLKAIELFEQFYPQLSSDQPQIAFSLKCIHFIDLIKQNYKSNSIFMNNRPSSLEVSNGTGRLKAMATNDCCKNDITSNGHTSNGNVSSSPSPIVDVPIIQNGIGAISKKIILSNPSLDYNQKSSPDPFVNRPTGKQCIHTTSPTLISNFFSDTSNSNFDEPPLSIIPSKEHFHSTVILDSENGHTCTSVKDHSKHRNTTACLELIDFGRELRDQACNLRQQGLITQTQINLLRCAFSMLAYQDPSSSPYASLFDNDYRANLCNSINSAILVHLKNPPMPVMECLIGLLEQVTTGETWKSARNTSHGSKSSVLLEGSSATLPNNHTTVMLHGQAYLAVPTTPSTAPLFDPFSPTPIVTRLDSSFYSLFPQNSPTHPNFCRSTSWQTSSFFIPSAEIERQNTNVGFRSISLETTSRLTHQPVVNIGRSSSQLLPSVTNPFSTVAHNSTTGVTIGQFESPQSAPPVIPVQRESRIIRSAPRRQQTNDNSSMGLEYAGFFHPSLFCINVENMTNLADPDNNQDLLVGQVL